MKGLAWQKCKQILKFELRRYRNLKDTPTSRRTFRKYFIIPTCWDLGVSTVRPLKTNIWRFIRTGNQHGVWQRYTERKWRNETIYFPVSFLPSFLVMFRFYFPLLFISSFLFITCSSRSSINQEQLTGQSNVSAVIFGTTDSLLRNNGSWNHISTRTWCHCWKTCGAVTLDRVSAIMA
jgi:hypothetical protein